MLCCIYRCCDEVDESVIFVFILLSFFLSKNDKLKYADVFGAVNLYSIV